MNIGDFVKLQNKDIEFVLQKDKDYGSSWRKRGGVGAFFVIARKADRIHTLADKAEVTFTATLWKSNPGDVRDDFKDLRQYLLLVSAYRLYGATEKNHLKAVADRDLLRVREDRLHEVNSVFDFTKAWSAVEKAVTLSESQKYDFFIEHDPVGSVVASAVNRLRVFLYLVQLEAEQE